MAMTLRLNEEDDALLTAQAEREGRSKQELAQEAIHLYLTRRAETFLAMAERSMARHQELVKRLA